MAGGPASRLARAEVKPQPAEFTNASEHDLDSESRLSERLAKLVSALPSAHPSGYYDVYLGREHEKATISLRSGWRGGVMAYVAGVQQPLKIIGFLRAGGAHAWIPMVASLEQRLTQSRSQTLSLRRGSTEKHYG